MGLSAPLTRVHAFHGAGLATRTLLPSPLKAELSAITATVKPPILPALIGRVRLSFSLLALLAIAAFAAFLPPVARLCVKAQGEKILG